MLQARQEPGLEQVLVALEEREASALVRATQCPVSRWARWATVSGPEWPPAAQPLALAVSEPASEALALVSAEVVAAAWEPGASEVWALQAELR